MGGKSPLLHLVLSDREPLYEQLKMGVRDAILRGDLSEGDPLPSFRKLAARLRVSLITVKRAYDDLAAEGVLLGRPGKGTFVASGAHSACGREVRRRFEEKIIEAMESARRSGMTDCEIKERLNELFAEEVNHDRARDRV